MAKEKLVAWIVDEVVGYENPNPNPECFNKKWYPVVVNKLNNLTQILYDCPSNSKDKALSFSETSIYSNAIDAIGG